MNGAPPPLPSTCECLQKREIKVVHATSLGCGPICAVEHHILSERDDYCVTFSTSEAICFWCFWHKQRIVITIIESLEAEGGRAALGRLDEWVLGKIR